MSDERFDDLSKAAASTTSRRGALKIIGGTLAGSLLAGGFFGGRAHAAGRACLPTGFACKVSGDCCEDPVTNDNGCCCRSPKLQEVAGSPGICTDRELCTEAGGVCHQ